MAYVRKNAQGKVIAYSQVPLEGFTELSCDTCSEIVDLATAAHSQSAAAQNALSRTDVEFIRVIEDLVMLLVEKHQIRFTDLPAPVQVKIHQRQQMRDTLHRQLNLLAADDDDKV